MKKTFTQYVMIVAALLFFTKGYGQSDTAAINTYDSMSLEDLLNLKIVSASKASESLLDAPLSASVITKRDILRNGCTSIMEALRLVPGLIVREQSNGNYDIHLRGMDNVPPNASFDLTSNTTTLVMIDNRPIYNYLRGGTFWETLPVDINDVEKIEVVRGPAAALYGPNAVNGVINIITRQVEKKGWYLNMNNRQGSNATYINNASIGYRFNRFSMIVSGNYQHRNRAQDNYYEYNRNTWLTDPAYMLNFSGDTVRDLKTLYPWPQLSMKKYAGNLFATYRISDKTKFSVSAGIQHSIAQRVSTENEVTPLSFVHSDIGYVDFRGAMKGITVQATYTGGRQATELLAGNKYDFHTFNGNVEYNYIKKRFSIKPGISYQSAFYDDRPYADIANKTGIFNDKGIITTVTASLRGEYWAVKNKLRFTGGLAVNKFNYPDTAYLSYQLAATYKLNKTNLVRLVFSGAPRSSNVFDTYVDQTPSYYRTGVNNYHSIVIKGNKNLRLLTAKMIEAGFRSELSKTVSLDVEAFHIWSKNYSFQLQYPSYSTMAGTDTVSVMPFMTGNLPMRLLQTGVTLSFTYTTELLRIKPFITLQHTEMKDYVASDLMPGISTIDINSGIGSHTTLKSTPAVYGGGSVDYKPGKKVNININSYYFSKQEYYHVSNLVYHDGVRGIDHIPGKFILNATVSYQPVNGLRLYCSGKNILGQTAREFYYTDKTPFMLLGGFSYQLP